MRSHQQLKRRNFLRGKDLEAKVFQLKKSGKDCIIIADDLGISVKKAQGALAAHAARHAFLYANEAEVEKRADLDRIKELTEAIYGRAVGESIRMIPLANGREVPITEPDPEFIKLYLMLSKRQSEILGYDAPKKVQAAVDVVTSTKEFDPKKLNDAELAQMQDLLEKALDDAKNKQAIPATSHRLVEVGAE